MPLLIERHWLKVGRDDSRCFPSTSRGFFLLMSRGVLPTRRFLPIETGLCTYASLGFSEGIRKAKEDGGGMSRTGELEMGRDKEGIREGCGGEALRCGKGWVSLCTHSQRRY